MARGFTQEYSIDYDKTFALMVKLTALQLLLAIAALNSWTVHQMDVIWAYLAGLLNEVIYMDLLEGYNGKGKVY